MASLNVPGVSIAVLKDGKIVWAQGYGVLETGKPTPVDTETIFQAASISKPISAIAALRLVEQGKLALDEPINDFLASWRVPDNRFTERRPVTLRQIMSHSAGFTVHGFPGYSGAQVLPTVVHVLDGEAPANTPAAAGLWTTPSDLLRLGLAVVAAARAEPNAILGPESTTDMLTMQAGSFGLGFNLEDRGDGKSIRGSKLVVVGSVRQRTDAFASAAQAAAPGHCWPPLESKMSIFTWLLAGGLIGWGACVYMGTPSVQAFIFNAVVATVGAAVGLWALQPMFDIAPGFGMLALTVGAACGTVLLMMVHFARLRIMG